MNEAEGLAPEVESILAAAAEREGGTDRLTVSARSFPEAFATVEAESRVPVIAEVKPTSPTTEGERHDDPAALAESMVSGGAAAISVLTEPDHFGGSPEALSAVRQAVSVPVLRKDFVLREDQSTPWQRMPSSDRAIRRRPSTLVAAARDRGFQPLVEVHSPMELDAALDAGADSSVSTTATSHDWTSTSRPSRTSRRGFLTT